jgi:hypothetical protein
VRLCAAGYFVCVENEKPIIYFINDQNSVSLRNISFPLLLHTDEIGMLKINIASCESCQETEVIVFSAFKKHAYLLFFTLYKDIAF